MIHLSPLGYGKNNNIHFQCKIGTKKNPVLVLKLVGFLSTGKAYITAIRCGIPSVLIDTAELRHILNNKLEKFDFEFDTITSEDWEVKNRTSVEILELIKYYS